MPGLCIPRVTASPQPQGVPPVPTRTVQLAPGEWHLHAVLRAGAGGGHVPWRGGRIQSLVAVRGSQGARGQPGQQREDGEDTPQRPLLQHSTAQRGEHRGGDGDRDEGSWPSWVARPGLTLGCGCVLGPAGLGSGGPARCSMLAASTGVWVSAHAAHTGWAPATGAGSTQPCPPRHQWQTGEAIKPAGSWHTSPRPNVPSSPPAPHNASHPLPAQPGPHTPHISLPGDAGRRDFAQHLSSGRRSRFLTRAARDARLCCKAAAGTGSTTGGALSHGPSLGMFFLLAVGA